MCRLSIKYIFLTLLLFSFTINIFAKDTISIDEVSFGIGKSHDNINVYRLGFKQDFQNTFYESNNGWLTGYYEASINYFGEINQQHSYDLALSPVFVYNFKNISNTIQPYVEAGIGLSYLSHTTIQTRNMGTHFQFEDRIGFGIKTNSNDLNIKYMHYSNADIGSPNDGIDIFLLTISHKF